MAVSFIIGLPVLLVLLLLVLWAVIALARRFGAGGVLVGLLVALTLGLAGLFIAGDILLAPIVVPDEANEAAVQVEPVIIGSLSEEWDRLNQPRIDLSGDETHEADSHAEEPAEEVTPEEATTEEAEPEEATTDKATTDKATTDKADEAEADAEPKRPDWVDVDYHMVGNTVRCSVKSDPYHTVDECHAALEIEIQDAVRARLARLAGVPEIMIPSLRVLGITNDYILREICREEYVETLEQSFGPMKRVHVLMEFRKPQDQRLVEAWRQYQRSGRLAMVGLFSLLAVGAVGLIFGLLKADTATKGYYTKRLFLGVPAAIMAAFALLVLIMEIADG